MEDMKFNRIYTYIYLKLSGINLQVDKPQENVNIKIKIIQPKWIIYFRTKILMAGLPEDSSPPASFYIENPRIVIIKKYKKIL